MKKSMYSLILIDDIVNAVDKLAYEQGTSRSNLINRIIAEHLNLITPEKRVSLIFERITEKISDIPELQVVGSPSATILTLKSALDYKYNPIIRYSVEISMERGFHVAELRVCSRTQSERLISLLDTFFEIWDQTERVALSDKIKPEKRGTQFSNGRYRRYLVIHNNFDMQPEDSLGDAIASYIDLMRRALALYFRAENGAGTEVPGGITGLYNGYLKGGTILI